MRTINTNLYKFSELSDRAKQRAIDNHYEKEDYYFMSDDLTESLKEYLKENNCEFLNIKLYYSLSYSQGDGVCFVGEVYKDGKKMLLEHTGRYYHSKSVNMYFENEQGEEIDNDEELKNIYFDVCNKIENEGYEIIEHRANFDEFNEFAECNEYEYYENGILY